MDSIISRSTNDGFYWAAALAFGMFGQWLVHHQYFFRSEVCGNNLKSAILIMIYKKVLHVFLFYNCDIYLNLNFYDKELTESKFLFKMNLTEFEFLSSWILFAFFIILTISGIEINKWFFGIHFNWSHCNADHNWCQKMPGSMNNISQL